MFNLQCILAIKILLLTPKWELIIELLCISFLPQCLLWITSYLFDTIPQNKSTCQAPSERQMWWILLFSWFTFNLLPWMLLIMQNYSFHKDTDLDIYKKALFSRSRTGLRGFKYCWQQQEQTEEDGETERGREGRGKDGGSQCPNPEWTQSSIQNSSD